MTNEEIEELIACPAMWALSKKDMADIMSYKAEHIKAHIPAWVFREIAERLHNEHFDESTTTVAIWHDIKLEKPKSWGRYLCKVVDKHGDPSYVIDTWQEDCWFRGTWIFIHNRNDVVAWTEIPKCGYGVEQ